MKRKDKAPAQTPEAPCVTCGPGTVRASYFHPGRLRSNEHQATVHYTNISPEKLGVQLGDSARSEAWVVIEDMVESVRDEQLAAALEAESTQAAGAYSIRAQGVELVLRALRNIRFIATQKPNAEL